MPRSLDSIPVRLSGRVYARLLALYPKSHRQEYGSPMAQLFRDQCRDAWAKARGWGLAVLWVGVLIDLIKTLADEHLQNLKHRTSMFDRLRLALRNNPALRTTFVAVFGVVFILVLGSSALLAFLAPEQYASTARIKVERAATDFTPEGYQRYVVGRYDPYFIQTQFELIRSETILTRVAERLHLAEAWGKFAGREKLSQADTIRLLKEHLDLRPVRNTSLIEIRVVTAHPKEASEIANALAATYREFRTDQLRSTAGTTTPKPGSVEIVDNAVPGLRPVRPNKPFTLFLGLFVGVPLASLVGGAGVCCVWLSGRFWRPWSASS